MTNQDIVRMLHEIAERLEVQGVQFKPRAYERAAESVEAYGGNIIDTYKEKGKEGLMEIPGIGDHIATRIEEFIQTEASRYLKKLRKKMPVQIEDLSRVEGIGPKKIHMLYERLGIRTIGQLERAARQGKIRGIPHFGKKNEERILHGIAFLKKQKGRFLLGAVLPLAQSLEDQLRRMPGVIHATVCGSIRRRQETIGDVDIVVTAKRPEKVMYEVGRMKGVQRILAIGSTKAMVRMEPGIEVDVRAVPEEVYGAAIQYFSGDKQHNIIVRTIASKKGYKLSEYGLFRGEKRIAAKTEEEIYKRLGMAYIPPELRTVSGEIEAAQEGTIPKLIPYGSLRGDLQVQTSWTDGTASIEQMVEAAQQAGLEYIAITDHTRSLAMTGGLDEKKLFKQAKEIDALNKKFVQAKKDFKILKSAEINILKNGSFDIYDEALKDMDIVCAAVHSNFNMSEEDMTERIIRALKHPRLNILFHPTGRLIQRREAYAVDMLKIIRAAKQYGVALEASAYPQRLDLRDVHIRMAVEQKVKLVIDSDAHAPMHFSFLNLGVAQARRGWATATDVLNTKSCAAFLYALKNLKK